MTERQDNIVWVSKDLNYLNARAAELAQMLQVKAGVHRALGGAATITITPECCKAIATLLKAYSSAFAITAHVIDVQQASGKKAAACIAAQSAILTKIENASLSTLFFFWAQYRIEKLKKWWARPWFSDFWE